MTPAIEQAAAAWIARRYAGLSREGQAEFERWLAADPRHAAAFAELETTWSLLDSLREPGPVVGAPGDDALAPRSRGRSGLWRASVLAAAAAVVLGYFVWWAPLQRALHYTGEAVTAVGGFQKLVLPDGSVVRLNTDSRIEVHYDQRERRVRLLRGEGHFTVTRDPRRPFLVAASGLAVRAVGTAFNVRLKREAVDVLVTEGTVRVESLGPENPPPRAVPATSVPGEVRPAAAVTQLVAGERAVIPAPANPAPPPVPATVVSAAEVERMLAWRDRRLEFDAAPLAEIAAEFNRYNRARLTIPDPALAARRFGGSFRADEPDHFVRLLRVRFGVRVEQRGDETILRAGP